MAYGAHRFLINNYITSPSMITTSSKQGGRISAFSTTQSGSADWRTAGSYTGEVDILVTVQIDSVAAGKSVGQATFRWKTSAAGGWVASGITTSSTYTTLANGIQIAFVEGTGDDFAVNDEGTFWCYAQYAGQNLIDNDRNIVWRASGDSAENIVIDLGTSLTANAVIIADHNLTGLATVTLQANTTDSWGSPAYSLALTVTNPHIYAYILQGYRYWRITFADSANPDGYIEIGELFIGNYQQLSAEWAKSKWGSSVTSAVRKVDSQNEAGVRRLRNYGTFDAFELDFEFLNATDLATLKTLWEGTFDTDTGAHRPIWVHYFYDEAATLRFCWWLADFTTIYSSYGLYKVQGVQFEEVAKTRV